MKLVLMIILIATHSVFAQARVEEFNKILSEDVQKDFKKDEEKFKTRQMRSPASVEVEHEAPIEETSKIDKSYRQIGPNKW